MIEFECPKCGEPMAIRDHMAGREIRCTGCDRRIEVPEDSPRRPGRRSADLPGLSSQEYWVYFLVFLVVPYACVFVSSILYYVWKSRQPKRANQINSLGFLVFGIQIALTIAYYAVFNK